MKVILSRKGFDSGYGGFPSPVLPDGTMMSLPIPVTEVGIRYSELAYSGKTYGEWIKSLMGSKLKVEGEGIFDVDHLCCHLDPDVRKSCYSRHSNWQGLFGQSGAAQSHLKNQQVGVGDLFLFFGWFRKTIIKNGKIIYDPSCKGFHAIYGYLQVGSVDKINSSVFSEWSQYHPHVSRGRNASELDHVYTAVDNLSFLSGLEGYGVFQYDQKLILTKSECKKSRWSLPSFMKHYKISYHTALSWKEDYFQSAAKGQEFVIDCDDCIMEWLMPMFEHVDSNG